MPPSRVASQPGRTSGRVTRPVLRYASQPASVRALSPPPVPVRLEINGIGEEEAIIELEDLQGAEEAGAPATQRPAQTEEGHDRVSLAPFIDPQLPAALPGPPPLDADGWASIDCWSAWDCAVTHHQPMEEVPGPFRKAFSTALATVVKRVNMTESAELQTRALKWLLILPKLLLREPNRGGGRGQGSGEVGRRFEALRERDWAQLLVLLKQDEEAELRRKGRRNDAGRPRGEQEEGKEEAKRLKTALSLIRRGQVGRARRRAGTNGVANMSCPNHGIQVS